MRRKRYRLDTILAPGEVLLGTRTYRVGDLIGSGAFAHVYQGTGPDGAPLAIKEFTSPTSRAQAEEIDRVFAHEQRIMAALSGHPAFPSLVEALDCEGRHYLVQSYVAGRTLEELLAEHGPYAEAQVVRWLIPLCAGVVHMHQQGIVHHDLKPANIKITPEHLPVVLDLGAAQVLGEIGAGFYGSDGYMPPEIKAMLQAGSLEAHKQTDVFALGCIMYQLLLGAQPTQEVIDQQSGRLVGPLLRRLDELHAGLVSVMTNAISFSQGYRYESAAQMLEDLQRRGPASLWASRERVDFQGPGHSKLREELVLRNLGGGTMECRLTTRTPWLSFAAGEEAGSATTVTGNQVVVQVIADTEPITAREVRQEGEITIKHELGELTIPCSLLVRARPAMAQAEVASLYLSTRRGQLAHAALGIRNIGEQAGQFTCRVASPGVSVSPVAFTLEPLQTIELAVRVDARALGPGSHASVLQVSVPSGHRLEVPLSIDVAEAGVLGYLAAKFRRNRRAQ